jgi:hypothetical protein
VPASLKLFKEVGRASIDALLPDWGSSSHIAIALELVGGVLERAPRVEFTREFFTSTPPHSRTASTAE